MSKKELGELIFDREREMWKAANNRDVAAFKELVADEAVMICGGYRCLGAEYAEYIKDFYLNSYEIKHEEVIYHNEEAVQIHYVIHIESASPEVDDLGGTFHVVSLWKKVNDLWRLYFNMDSRILFGS